MNNYRHLLEIRFLSEGKLSPALTESRIFELLAMFTDSKEVSGWASEAIADCLETGVINGRANTLLCPEANITRAEVAVIVQRLLQNPKLI